MPAYSSHMNVMLRACQKAARGLVRDFGELEKLQVSKKGVNDFFTQADTRAEEILHQELHKARPQYGFLMEESGEVLAQDSSYAWIIDPLDGTFNFMHGNPFFCISLALCIKSEVDQWEPIAGVIYSPMSQEIFWAEKGQGAWLEINSSVHAIATQRLRVSSRTHLSDSLLCIGSLARGKQANYFKTIDMLVPQVMGARSMGSSALSLAYTAAGRFDVFIQSDLRPWDFAAGIVLMREAGGKVTDIHGGNGIFKTNSILATNGPLHSACLVES